VTDVSESSDFRSLAVKSVEVQGERDGRGTGGLSLPCEHGSKASVRGEVCESLPDSRGFRGERSAARSTEL